MSPTKKIISSDSKSMLTARAAALRLNCAPDYVGKLCREGRLVGELKKDGWLVDEESIGRFEAVRVAAREARSQELASLRRKENRDYVKTNGTIPQKIRASVVTPAFGAQTLAFAFGFILLAAALVSAAGLGNTGTLAQNNRAILGATIARVQSPFFGTPEQMPLPSFKELSKPLATLWGNTLAFFTSHQTSHYAQNTAPRATQENNSQPTAAQPVTPTPAVSQYANQPAATPIASAPATIIEQHNTYPVIERVVAGGAVSGVSEEELTAKLNDLAASMRSQLYAGFNPAPSPTYASGGILNNLAMAQNIDNLTGVTIGGATITGSTVEGYLPLQGGALSGDLALGNIVASGALTVVGAGSFGTASTTNLAISGSTTLSNIAAGTLLYNDSSKKVAAATIDPSLTFAQGALALNTANPNAFTSLQQFNGNASTTALSAGLAYFGTTATSTFTSQGWLGIATSSPSAALAVEGNGYFTGGLGIGLATTTPGALQTSGDVAVGGNLLVTGNSTVLGNSTVIGNSSAGTLAINSSINSSVVPNQNITYDLGSPSYFWRSAYIGNLSVNNISANQTTIGGTQSDTFVLNSDNVSADAEDAHLVFFRGNVVPNALLSWSSVAKRFEFNQPLFVQNASGNGGGVVTMTLKGLAGQSADLFNIASSSGAQYLAIDNAGAFTLNGAATLTSALGVAGDTTLANATSTSLNTNTLGLGNNYFTSLLGTGLTNTNGVLTVSALPNAALANSTISGIALGGSLANLSATDGTLAFSGAYNGSAAQTVGLNLGNANTWNALQQFNSGLTAFASSTIGNGTQTGGLTISGGATTTGNAYFAGNLSVGTTSQSRALTISGSTGFTDGVFSAVNNYSTGGNNSFSMTSPNMPVANETYFNLGVSNTPNNWFSEGFYYAGPGSLQNRMDLVFNSQQIPALSILASDNVGIGTTTPYSRLSVWGADTSANTTAFNVVNSASTTLFAVNDDGRVGVGTVSPATTFQISQSTTAYFQLGLTNTATGGSTWYVGSTATGWSIGGGKFVIGNTTASSQGKLVIDSTGNVGIGNTSPSYALDVSGFINTSAMGGFKQAGNTILYASSTNFSTFGGIGAGAGIIAMATSSDNTSGPYSTAFGYNALNATCTGNCGYNNSAFGYNALAVNTSGWGNTANGTNALSHDTTASWNTATGFGALYTTTIGAYNVANGVNSLYFNNGYYNTAVGGTALYKNSSANYNTGVGYGSLYNNQTGANNTALGYNALYSATGGNNIAIGFDTASTTTSGNNNIAIGYDIALPSTTGSNQLNIGNLIFGTGINGEGTNVSTGNIAVGTTTPYSRLSVWGKDTLAGNGAFEVTNSASTTLFRVNDDGSAYVAGNVGMGTLSPGTGTVVTGGGMLDIERSTTNAAVSILRLGATGNNYFDFSRNSSTGALYLQGNQTGYNNIVLAPTSGNVGIGTTTPGANLDIRGANVVPSSATYGNLNVASNDPLAIDKGGTITLGGMTSVFDTAPRVLGAIRGLKTTASDSGTPSGYLAFLTSSAGTVAERMRIDSSGNMGIGTTTPYSRLSVWGADTSANTTAFSVNNSASTTLFAVNDSGNVGIGTLPTGYRQTVLNSSGGTGNTLLGNSDLVVGGGVGSGMLFDFGASSGNTYGRIGAYSSGLGAWNNLILQSGGGNVGIGNTSPSYALDVSGFINTDSGSGYKIGGQTVFMSSSTLSNLSVGYSAGAATTTTGTNNVAIGLSALAKIASGASNTVVGNQAGAALAGASTNNTILGYAALSTNAGTNNAVAVGYSAMSAHGGANVAIGTFALAGSGTGLQNAIVGNNAGYNDTSGGNNVFFGQNAGYSNTTGNNNIALGWNTGSTTSTGSNNIALGYDIALPSINGSNQLNIGNLIFGTGINGEGTNVSTGNIGIGTTTPYSRLSVWGSDTSANTTAFNVVNSASTTLFAVNDNGTVGVGTTNPAYLFDVRPSTGDAYIDISAATNFSPILRLEAQGSRNMWISASTTLNNTSMLFSMNNGANPYMTISGTNGNVGIGTTTPGNTLQISNSATTQIRVSEQTGAFYFDFGRNASTGLFQFNGNQGSGYSWQNSGTEVMRISSGGNVGIGTATPYSRLSVWGKDTSANTTAFNVVNSASTTLLSVLDNGYVGIGTALPLEALHVMVTATAGTNPNTLLIQNTSGSANSFSDINLTSSASLTAPSTLAQIRLTRTNRSVAGDSDISFSTFTNSALTEKMRIMDNGNVGIGTTTPYTKLSVWGADTSANTTAFNVVNSASTTEFQVYDDGHAVLAGALTQNSDQRLKTNIQVLDFSSSLSAIDSLNPVSFTWVNGMFGEGSQLGFIAQDVQKSFPQLVSTTSATALTPDGTLGLNYTGLIAPIIGAVQGIAHIAGDFKSNLIAWLGSAGNGIGKLFAHEVHTNDLCVKKSDGTEVCITGDQLSALLAGQAAGASAGGGAAPSGSGSSGVGDSSTPSAGAGSSDTGGAADTGSGASSSDTSGTTSGDTTPITPAADATPATPAAPDPAASAPTTPDPTPAPVAATQ